MAKKHALVKPTKKVNVDKSGRKRRAHRVAVMGGNGEQVSISQPYYDRATATRAARDTGLPVKFA